MLTPFLTSKVKSGEKVLRPLIINDTAFVNLTALSTQPHSAEASLYFQISLAKAFTFPSMSL